MAEIEDAVEIPVEYVEVDATGFFVPEIDVEEFMVVEQPEKELNNRSQHTNLTSGNNFLRDGWSSPCFHDESCPRFVEYGSEGEYLAHISDIELAWFEHQCKDPLKVHVSDWNKRVFFNHSAYVHWLKWGSSLECQIKGVDAKKKWICKISQDKPEDVNSAYITRASVTCLDPRSNYELFFDQPGRWVRFGNQHGSVQLWTDIDDILLHSTGEYEVLRDCTTSQQALPLAYTVYAAQENNIVASLIPRAPQVRTYFDGEAMCLSTPDGPLRTTVMPPPYTTANARLQNLRYGSLTLVIPFLYDSERVWQADLGYLGNELVSLGQVENYHLIVNVDEDSNWMIHFNSTCTCLEDRYHEVDNTKCLLHGVWANFMGIKIWVGMYSPPSPCEVWMRFNWPHSEMPQLIARGIPNFTDKALVHLGYVSLKNVYQDTERGVVWGWNYPDPTNGAPRTYMQSQIRMPFRLSYHGRHFQLIRPYQPMEAVGLPIDLLICLTWCCPEWIMALRIFLLVHEIEKKTRLYCLPLAQRLLANHYTKVGVGFCTAMLMKDLGYSSFLFAKESFI